jgi:hypothetical protein
MGYSTSGFRRKRPPQTTRESSFLDRVAMTIVWSCACEGSWAFDLEPVWKPYFYIRFSFSQVKLVYFSFKKYKSLKNNVPKLFLNGVVRNIRGWLGTCLCDATEHKLWPSNGLRALAMGGVSTIVTAKYVINIDTERYKYVYPNRLKWNRTNNF